VRCSLLNKFKNKIAAKPILYRYGWASTYPSYRPAYLSSISLELARKDRANRQASPFFFTEEKYALKLSSHTAAILHPICAWDALLPL